MENGLIGTIVGTPLPAVDLDEDDDPFRGHYGSPPEGYQEEPQQLGLVQLGDDGADQEFHRHRWTRWVVEGSEYSVGHPQLAPLGDGSYLLGWGDMRRIGDESPGGLDFQVPWRHHVRIINAEGETLSEPLTLDDVGWGEQDRWVSLGQGRVAWVYFEDPLLIDRRTAPECSRSELLLSVYHLSLIHI